ncbi:vegetative cell wall protein gp1-like [Schistocerca americana]|uniref:vegetative cell wall protein gp1-like n=1 Tax=Schistocerca americana TaxID=7009 RepID=UPI001F4FE1DA|nr:vegetative cell wall protein gp1-like [Schistocerca americana]
MNITEAQDTFDYAEYLVRGGFQPRLPTSLPPPGQQQQPSPLPRRQPVPLMPPAQLHPGAPQVVAPAPAVPLQSPPPSDLMDVDPSAGPPSQAVAVQPVLQPLSFGTPKESDTAAPCPAPTQQPSTQRQETLPLFMGPDAPSRPVPEAAPVVTENRPRLESAGAAARRTFRAVGGRRGQIPAVQRGAARTAARRASIWAAAAAAAVAAGPGAQQQQQQRQRQLRERPAYTRTSTAAPAAMPAVCPPGAPLTSPNTVRASAVPTGDGRAPPPRRCRSPR